MGGAEIGGWNEQGACLKEEMNSQASSLPSSEEQRVGLPRKLRPLQRIATGWGKGEGSGVPGR